MARAAGAAKPVTPAGQVRPTRNALNGGKTAQQPGLRASAFSGGGMNLNGSMTAVGVSRDFGRHVTEALRE